MMNIKLPLIVLFAVILISAIVMPSAIAAPPITQVGQFATGLEIVIPKIQDIKQGENFTFHTHIFNISNGLSKGVKPTCTLHLYNSAGKEVNEAIMLKDTNNVDYNLFTPKSNWTTAGTHAYIIGCNMTSKGLGGFVSGEVQVSKTGRDEADWANSNLILVLAAIGLAIIFIMISNSLAPEHVLLKLMLLFFAFGMMYAISDVVNKVNIGSVVETTSNMIFYSITWLYRIFVGYIILYTMYISFKWIGWFDGLKGWFKK